MIDNGVIFIYIVSYIICFFYNSFIYIYTHLNRFLFADFCDFFTRVVFLMSRPVVPCIHDESPSSRFMSGST